MNVSDNDTGKRMAYLVERWSSVIFPASFTAFSLFYFAEVMASASVTPSDDDAIVVCPMREVMEQQ